MGQVSQGHENQPERRESPLRAQLREIAAGRQSLPHSVARRHHFVPAFSLAQFAQPAGSRTGWLSQIDVRTGTPQRTRPQDAAFDRDLYTYEDQQGELSRSVETFFSVVEQHAALSLERLREDPAAISPQDRETISFFLALQESRTPAGLIRIEQMRQVVFEIQASLDLSNASSFRKAFASEVIESLSPSELEEMRLRLRQQLLNGQVRYEAPRAGALKQILNVATEIAMEIYSLDWTVLTATGDEFVTSDRPISMVDTTPEHPWSGNAWKSSPGAISFYPLSPTSGLFITPGEECGYSLASSRPDQVRRLNLMTLGWADRYVFGTSQQVVCRVRQQSRDYPGEVAVRRSPRQVILVPPDSLDSSVTADYVRRGWPKGFLVADNDGQRRPMGYVVVDFDDPPGVAARKAMEIAEGLGSRSA